MNNDGGGAENRKENTPDQHKFNFYPEENASAAVNTERGSGIEKIVRYLATAKLNFHLPQQTVEPAGGTTKEPNSFCLYR